MAQEVKYTQRLTNVLKRAEQDGKLRIGFIGGSITQGCNPSIPENAYVEKVIKWFNERLPKVEIEKINAGVGATGSLIGVHRVRRDITSKKPDIVFVEFAANDAGYEEGTHLSYESLIRTIITDLPEAAVIEIFMTLDTGDSREEEETQIAEHYQLPTVSYRQEVFNQIKEGVYKWEDIATDEVHPNDKGHEIIKSLIVNLVEEAMKHEYNPEFTYTMPEKVLFGTPYFQGKLIEFNDLKMIETTGFSFVPESFRTINTGYKASEEAESVYLKCEVEGKNVFLLFVKGIEKERAKVKVKVNGEEVGILDTSFEGGWGNYPETYSLVKAQENQINLIEIEMIKDDTCTKLDLLGFLVS